MEDLLEKYKVKPMVGVIPHNEDHKQQLDQKDPFFWKIVEKWEQKGWAIAMHGYNHVYSSKEGGINPLWNKSEFAGIPLDLQRDKIRKGVAIMRKNGFNPIYFFAPSHTFDENTLVALKEESDIRIICDTIAAIPYKRGGVIFIPQQSGHPIKLPFGGFVTICYHPNTMNDEAFSRLESFLKDNKNIISFDKVDIENLTSKTAYDRILSWMYFLRRKLR